MSSSENATNTTFGSSTMVDDESSTSKKQKCILITHGDSYVGHALAMHIAEQLTRKEGQLKKKHWCVMVLCQDKKNCKDLEKRGILVKEVDYESQDMIRDQMKEHHIKTLIFNPFCKSEDRFAEHGKNVLDSAYQMKVKRVMMVSMYGCSHYKEVESPLGKFNLLEEHLRCSYKYGYWVVFRIPMIQQFFFLWTKMVQSKNAMGLPISDSSMLETVNLKDVCDCLCQSALSKKSMVWREDGQNASSPSNDVFENREESQVMLKRVYDLTCGKPMNLTMIAEAITHAFKEEGFDTEIVPMVITEEQLETYLKHLSKEEGQDNDKINTILSTIFPTTELVNNNKDNNNGSAVTNSLANRFMEMFKINSGSSTSRINLESQDDPNLYPYPPKYLTTFQIQVILDNFRFARSLCAPLIPPINKDVRDITGRDAVDLEKFFMNNSRHFRPE